MPLLNSDVFVDVYKSNNNNVYGTLGAVQVVLILKQVTQSSY